MTADAKTEQENTSSTDVENKAPVDPPVAEQPATEQPAAEQPTQDEATAEAPPAEEPSVERLATEVQEAAEPVAEAPAAEEPKTEAPATEVVDQQAGATSDPVAEQATPEEVAAPEAQAATPAEAPAASSEQILIGTQREHDVAEPAKPAPEFTPSSKPQTPPEAKKYPPPNVRDQLSPELEQELAAAMEGQSLDALIESSVPAEATGELEPETKVTGTVIKVHNEDVFVDLGGPNQGSIPLKQFTEPEGGAAPEIGAKVEAVVVAHDEEQGIYTLTLPTGAVEVGNWDDVQEGQTVEVTVSGHNKGGLECKIAGLRGFIPMGQISVFRVEKPEEFVGQKLHCVVTEANRSRRNLVLSHRAVMERERQAQKEKRLTELSKGDIVEGTVRNLRDFGAFVDIGGVDGLIHVSQLSWDRVGHPKEVLQVGQQVKVRVEKIDRESGKIGLGYRDLAANPWEDVPSKYPVGGNIKGTVSKLMQFGAFVKLEPGVEGLIHISELGHGRVQRTGDVVSEGQEVEVKVLSVDTDAQRIGLSLKALMPAPERPERQPREPEPVIPSEEEQAERSRRRQKGKNLKGGLGGPSGGEQFGLKW